MPSESTPANGLDDKMRRIAPHDLLMLKNIPLDQQAAFADAEPAPAAPPSCSYCGGAGYYKHAVPFGHPDFGVLFPCACRLEEKAERVRRELLARSNLRDFADKTFDTFSRFVPKVEPAYSRVVAFSKRPQGWLVLFGTYGCGKTHLIAAAANALVDREIAIYFAVVPDLLDHLRVAFKPEAQIDYDDLFDHIRNVAVLFLDDLGTENATPWAKEKLFQLINHRYNTRQPTVITSNRQPGDLDQRIYSRVCDPALGEPIEMEAGDYRRRKQATKGKGHA